MCEISEEITYHIRTSLMYTNLTKEVLLKLFKFLIKNEDISGFLSSLEQHNILWKLLQEHVISKTDYYLVCDQVVNLDKFDISLLIKLILNLCEENISKPKCGWKNKPNPKDECLGADLLRLRYIRNKLIGHLPVAKLSKGAYEKTWANIKAILLRVVELVDPKSSENFEQRIDEYKGLHLDTIKTLWDEWLQEKVEELFRRSQDFQEYYKEKLERFGRYIKLLFYGGRIVLCGKLKTKLGEQHLSDVVERKKETLTRNIGDKFSSCLYSQGSCLDYKNWDISLLASVLLLACNDDLSQDEIKYITRIQSDREKYAILTSKSLDTDTFLANWTDLINCLINLSVNIPKGDKLQVENLIERYKKKDDRECGAEEYIKQLKTFGVDNDVHNETIVELKDMLEQMSQEGIKFKKEHVIKLGLLTNCENEETKKIAEDLLKQCLQNSIQKSDEPQDPVEKEIVKLQAILSAVPDVTSVQRNRKRKNQTPINYPIKRSNDTKR